MIFNVYSFIIFLEADATDENVPKLLVQSTWADCSIAELGPTWRLLLAKMLGWDFFLDHTCNLMDYIYRLIYMPSFFWSQVFFELSTVYYVECYGFWVSRWALSLAKESTSGKREQQSQQQCRVSNHRLSLWVILEIIAISSHTPNKSLNRHMQPKISVNDLLEVMVQGPVTRCALLVVVLFWGVEAQAKKPIVTTDLIHGSLVAVFQIFGPFHVARTIEI